MCSVDDYMARVRRLPLHLDRPSADGEAFIYRTDAGVPVRVTSPHFLGTDEKRAAAIEMLEAFYAPTQH